MIDASSPGAPWTQASTAAAGQGRRPRAGAAGVDAWITGIRREQAPTRAGARKLERDERRGIWKFNPLADWSEKDLWRYIVEHDLPYNPLHDHGLRVDRLRAVHAAGEPAARAAGPARTRPSAAFTCDRRMSYELSDLETLEAESIFIMREVAAELERPVLLFSGGKDSIVLLRLAEKAFRPGRFPFPVMHVDTGHNFPEVIEFRDRLVARSASA